MEDKRTNQEKRAAEDIPPKVEKAYLQEDGTIRRETRTVDAPDEPRSESGPTGTYGEGDRTDRDSWLSAGMADERYSENPEGFYKDKDRSGLEDLSRDDDKDRQ
ncbi:hypothetical protein [Planococcus lenghuensis]|uniref:Uncharacterized protein n=1 Tax=Planococcus lenghuensis TaxID=2213202 RepID=A0A1Q2KV99_9BACL|nr:hypothetical protein [Planococcus lenghuensis]AQQ52109.1 hypothetical protein B0X71_02530 [Planococcus lenghuensis]